MICPVCGSLCARKSGRVKLERMAKTGLKQYSYQAFRCDRGHFFSQEHSFSPYTNSFIEYAVFVYLRSLSLNSTADILNAYFEKKVVSKKTLLGFVAKVSDVLPSLLEIDYLFYPKRSGYLAFDGVFFKLNGESFVVLVCFDPETFDIIDYLKADEENYNNYTILMGRVKERFKKNNTNVSGVYFDGDRGLVQAVKTLFPDTPKQVCIVHKYIKMGDTIPFKSAGRKSVHPLKKRKILKFKELFESVLSANTRKDSVENLKILEQFVKAHSVAKYFTAYRSLRLNFEFTLTHFDYPHMQRDNNFIECFNSIITTKLDLLKGFKKEENIEKYLKLVFLDYRFRKLKESRIPYRKKNSPLELAQVNLPKHFNYIKFLRQSLNLNFES